MGPPGGGKSYITPWMQRHMNVVSFIESTEEILTKIFWTILGWYFGKGEFSMEIMQQEEKVVLATMKVYTEIQRDLKPTPAKSHYTFNLWDFSKVIMGICMAGH